MMKRLSIDSNLLSILEMSYLSDVARHYHGLGKSHYPDVIGTSGAAEDAAEKPYRGYELLCVTCTVRIETQEFEWTEWR